MNRFLLFSGDYYYPSGGWDDLVGIFATVNEAKTGYEPREWTWAHIVDTETGEVVLRRDGSSDGWPDTACPCTCRKHARCLACIEADGKTKPQ